MESKLSYDQLKKRFHELKMKLEEQQPEEDRLKENHKLYQAIFEHAGVAMMLTDFRTGKVEAYNGKAHLEMGMTAGEYEETDSRDYLFTDDETYQENLKHLIAQGSHAYHAKMRKKDGILMDAWVSAVLVGVGGKKHIHSIRVDITDHKKAETRLREKEKRYRDILENMKEGYYEVDLAGHLTFFNTAFSRMYGYPPEELLGMNNRHYMSPETAENVYRFFNGLFRTGKTPVPFLEYEVIRKDRSILSAEISVSLHKNAQGEVIGFRGVVRDNSEKKQMEKELRAQESLYRSLFDHAGFSIVLTDARTGSRMAYNKRSYEELGYTEDEYKELTPSDLYESGVEGFAEDIRTVLEKGSHTSRVGYRSKSGEIRDFFRSSVKVKIRGKACIHVIRADITDRKKAEQTLKESETLFKTVFEAAADPIFLTDPVNGRILDLNPAAFLGSGYSREELLDMAILDLVDPDQTLTPMQPEDFVKELEKHGRLFFEFFHRKKDGSKLIVEISSCLAEQNGEKVVLSLVRDVTDRKQKEAELDRYRQNLEDMVHERTRKLEDAQRELVNKEKLAVLGQLTATVSHELRNPLGVIQSSGYYLQKKAADQDAKIQKHLKRIEEQVEVCDGIIGDLLEYTRGKKAVLLKENIHAWLPELMEKMSVTQGIQLHGEFPEKLPLIFHDPAKLQLALVNLLNNAVQAVREQADQCKLKNMPYAPDITLCVREEKDLMVFEVSDNGSGMDEQTRNRAFDPLFTTRSRGTGLGLPNVQKIIDEHGGKIAVTSAPGLGTRVSFSLPNKGGME